MIARVCVSAGRRAIAIPGVSRCLTYVQGRVHPNSASEAPRPAGWLRSIDDDSCFSNITNKGIH
jgi:hypothetical protein